MRHLDRRKFDETRDFVARKQISVSGISYPVGSLVPKSALNPRRLRQLFEWGKLDFATPDITLEDVKVEKLDSGWWQVTLPNGKVEKVLGKAKLEARLSQLKQAQNAVNK